MTLIQEAKKIYWAIYFKILTRKSEDGVEYVYKKRQSDKLLIVFSSMIGKYNFMRALKNASADQLYIRDCWADNNSYYWFENKEDYPERYTQNLIETILRRRKYNEVVTLGSSKGGTAAIYYGLKNNVNLIYAGACQYRVGDYLGRYHYPTNPEKWEKVVGGGISDEWMYILDHKLEELIESKAGSQTRIKLIYSTEEHTYPEHMVPLIQKLDECGIIHEDQIERFNNHSCIGVYFKNAIKGFFAPTK